MTPQNRTGTTTVVRADAADIGVLSQLIAEAFHDLPPSVWLIGDPDTRRQIFPGYFQLYVQHAMTHGIVHTTPGRTAVALWLPIGEDGPPQDPGYQEKLAAATSPRTDRFTVFDQALERHHPTGTSHHHLAILAVHPDHQRKGTGTALLHAHHTTLDANAIPAYLEASHLPNRRLYLTHGYRDHGHPIHLPGGPHMYPMWRTPQR